MLGPSLRMKKNERPPPPGACLPLSICLSVCHNSICTCIHVPSMLSVEQDFCESLYLFNVVVTSPISSLHIDIWREKLS